MKTPARGRRRGSALVLMLVVLLLIGLATTGQVRSLMRQRLALERTARTIEAGWLVESGIGLARARLAGDRDFEGETWTIAAGDLVGRRGATVEVRVTPAEDDSARRVAVRVTYPAEGPRRTVLSRTVKLSLQSPEGSREP